MSEMYAEEGFSPAGAEIVDFTNLQGTNCYCDEENLKILSESIGKGPFLNWIDSGDYHYLSALTTLKTGEPFELVLFDHHTDRQQPEFDILSCGGWVAWAEECNPNLRHTVSIGPPATISPETPIGTQEPSRSEEPFFHTGLPVYLSIDLDVLSPEEFHTNWDQGTMRLEELASLAAAALQGRRVLGVDVCGGVTRGKGATDAQLAHNLAVRKQIISIFAVL